MSMIAKMLLIKQKQGRAMLDIAEYCKVLEPSLRDANLHHQADRLAALLGALEAVKEELNAAIQSDPQGAFEMLLRQLESQSDDL